MNLYGTIRLSPVSWMLATIVIGFSLAGGLLVYDSTLSASKSATQPVADSAPQTAVRTTAPSIEPTNPLFAQDAIKIVVDRAGMQELRGADVITAMQTIQLSSVQLDLLRLAHMGAEIAIEVIDTDNLLDETTRIRFYAPHRKHSLQVGNQWNSESIYWLSMGISQAGGLRMQSRSVVPDTVVEPPLNGVDASTYASKLIPERRTGYQRGIWENNRYYVSLMAGYDDDEFYAERFLRELPTSESDKREALAIRLEPTLPHAVNEEGDTAVFQFSAAARTVATHTLRISLTHTIVDESWANTERYEPWVFSIETARSTQELFVSQLPGSARSDIYFDKLYWTLPVQLDFEAKGAEFIGAEGEWLYQLTGVADDGNLYDVSNPAKPVILIKPAGDAPRIQDGPKQRTYALVTRESVGRPAVVAHTSRPFTDIVGKDSLYIAPINFHSALEPLLELRKSQGYHPVLIDPQRIYDAWNYGYSSPEAIRHFLQYAASQEKTNLLAAVLVGDTTHDPLNYIGYRDGGINYNHVPTFLESIDPSVGVVPCDTCFGQLDGDQPFVLETAHEADIDLWIGRLPVSDEAQLETLVRKLINYETDTNSDPEWRNTSVYFADNQIRSNCTIDNLADFGGLADELITNWQSPEMTTRRLYYDPRSTLPQDCEYYSADVAPWQEPNADTANQTIIELHSAGAALVTYVGRANQTNMGVVEDESAMSPYLLKFGDIGEITNDGKPFIGLRLGSSTSRFTHLSRIGASIDERQLLLPTGGAVATWGSTGVVNVPSAVPLLEGWHQELWSVPPSSNIPMGQLVLAGLEKFSAEESCCPHLKFTYALLGDPLMHTRIGKVDAPVATPTNMPMQTPPAPTDTPIPSIPPPTPTITATKSGTPMPPSPTPSPTSTVVPNEASLASNFSAGAPGSYFVLQGSEYIPEQAVEILINGIYVATVTADGNGTFMLLLFADVNMSDSEYDVVALQAGVSGSAGATASTTIAIDMTSDKRTSPVDPGDPNVPLISLLPKLYLPIFMPAQ